LSLFTLVSQATSAMEQLSEYLADQLLTEYKYFSFCQ
jgi:hypothetical protein